MLQGSDQGRLGFIRFAHTPQGSRPPVGVPPTFVPAPLPIVLPAVALPPAAAGLRLARKLAHVVLPRMFRLQPHWTRVYSWQDVKPRLSRSPYDSIIWHAWVTHVPLAPWSLMNAP